jgi:hypothetical protein
MANLRNIFGEKNTRFGELINGLILQLVSLLRQYINK